MNNIYFGQQLDPQQTYPPQYILQQTQRDWLGELDELTRGLESTVTEILNDNLEFADLSAELSHTIQAELMNLVKGRLNNNKDIVDNVQKQIRLIKDAKNTAQEKQRKGMAELNDYITNYSHLTFDEYKSLKNEKKN